MLPLKVVVTFYFKPAQINIVNIRIGYLVKNDINNYLLEHHLCIRLGFKWFLLKPLCLSTKSEIRMQFKTWTLLHLNIHLFKY